MTLGEVLSSSAEYLARKGIDTPRLDAELILAQAFGMSRLELYTSFDRPLTEAELALARPLVERRGRREPLAYVLGDWGFRRLALRTDARALVPRPETEIVVERALAAYRRDRGAAGRRRRHRHRSDRARDRRRASRRPGHRDRHLARRPRARTGERRPARARDRARRDEPPRRPRRPLRPRRLEPALRRRRRDRRARAGGPRLGAANRARRRHRTRRSPRRAATRLARGGALVLESHAEKTAELAAALESLGYENTMITRDLAGRERVVEARWT